MMNYNPEALLSRPQSYDLPWPLPTQALMYYNQHVIDKLSANHTTPILEDNAHPNQFTAHRRRPIRVYHASPYDISGFLQALERVRHRSVNTDDMLIQIPPESVPPYTQEILYLINNNYFFINNFRFPPIKLVPHTSKTVSGFSLAWLTTDFYGKTMLPFKDSRRPYDGAIGLCSIFYLPLGSLNAMRHQTREVSDLYKVHSSETNLTSRDNSELETILSEIYQSCREYQVRYCVLTDGHDSKVVELFEDSYMDHHSPYDIVLLSDNNHRSVPLTLGGLLWDVLLSVCHDVRDSVSMNG